MKYNKKTRNEQTCCIYSHKHPIPQRNSSLTSPEQDSEASPVLPLPDQDSGTLLEILEDYDCTGETIVTPHKWEEIKARAEETFTNYDCFTISGM